MPNAISRLHSAFETWSFKYNCYEAVHPWTPYCSHSALELGLTVFGEAIKLYTPLYLFSQVMQRRYDYGAFARTSQSILRSTTFISANAFFAMFLFCSSKHCTGKFYYHVMAYLPGFIASSMAVLIEKPNRRSSLAFYVANVASETLFRIWVARGYLRPINYGQVYLFTFSMAAIMMLAKRRGFEDDALSAAIKLIVGPEEAACRISRQRRYRKKNAGQMVTVGDQNALPEETTKGIISEGGLNDEQTRELVALANANDRPLDDLVEAIDTVIEKQQQAASGAATDNNSANLVLTKLIRTYRWIKRLMRARHSLCPHRDSCSCLYYTLNASGRAFLVGCTSQLALRLLTKAPILLNGQSDLRSILFGNANNIRPIIDTGLLRLGLFLSTFSGLYKVSNCLLRWTLNTSNSFSNFLAGLVAGPTFFIYPSPTVALYVLWKCLEILFHEAVSHGYIKQKELYIVILYGLATNQLFYSALMDPNHMKRSYMNFLNKMSHHKLHMVNRTILDIFGTESSSGYEEYFPDLHPAFMSDAFLGSIWIWMLDSKFQVGGGQVTSR